MIVRSRVVLPVAQPPIENGAVEIVGQNITAVGKWPSLRKHSTGPVADLWETILLPGLINAHCHLDYTNMAGLLAPSKSFADWAKGMVAMKAGWGYSDFAVSWVNGAEMLLHTGTTTVANIEAVPDLLPEVWSSTPIRVLSFLELTSVRSGRPADEVLHMALGKIDSLQHPRNRAFLSPHALYSTTPSLVSLAHAISAEKRWPITMHVAESAAEDEMFRFARGPLFDWLKHQRDMSDCTGHSPVRMLAAAGVLSSQLLAVHANYLTDGDAELLANNRCNVVHCPRSHEYFCHGAFPFEDLSSRETNVCLGTDSLASMRSSRKHRLELNLFTEMQHFASAHQGVEPSQILEMVTVNASKALGIPQLGKLSPGCVADLIAVPYSGKVADAESAAVHNCQPVAASMIQGEWVIR